MKILQYLITTLVIELGTCQVNPNYVLYNPNMDIYRKPDHWSRASMAQRELALKKFALSTKEEPKPDVQAIADEHFKDGLKFNVIKAKPMNIAATKVAKKKLSSSSSQQKKFKKEEGTKIKYLRPNPQDLNDEPSIKGHNTNVIKAKPINIEATKVAKKKSSSSGSQQKKFKKEEGTKIKYISNSKKNDFSMNEEKEFSMKEEKDHSMNRQDTRKEMKKRSTIEGQTVSHKTIEIPQHVLGKRVGSPQHNSAGFQNIKGPQRAWENDRPLSEFIRNHFRRLRGKMSATKNEERNSPKFKMISLDENSKKIQENKEEKAEKLHSRDMKRTDHSEDRSTKDFGFVGSCPRKWSEETTFCMRKTRNGEKFRDSVVSCISSDSVHNGPGPRLITVGKLRKLLEITPFVNKFHNHAYRINAFKDYDGLWKEFPIGRVIDFSYYPDFNPAWGKHTDTLIWMSRWNSLRVIRDTQDRYKGLCFREKLGELGACNPPPALECSDHGDCISGSCVCDSGFTGADCSVNVTRSAVRYVQKDPAINCLTDCGPGGGCDTTTGTCVCAEGTFFNDTTGSCECKVPMESGHCYVLGPKEVDYETAAKFCISRGLSLVEIHDEADQKDVENMVQGKMNVWMGADNVGYPSDGFRWHSGLEVSTGHLGGWSEELSQVGCLALSGVIGHTWITTNCNLRRCCGDMTIDTLCRVY